MRHQWRAIDARAIKGIQIFDIEVSGATGETRMAARDRLAGVGPVRLVRVHAQHLEHALRRRQGTLQLGKGVDDVPDRIEQQEGVPLKRHDVADRSPADQV